MRLFVPKHVTIVGLLLIFEKRAMSYLPQLSPIFYKPNVKTLESVTKKIVGLPVTLVMLVGF